MEANVSPWNTFGLVFIYTALGKKDEAFKWLTHEPNLFALPWMTVYPELYDLHDDPRFVEFVKQFDIPKK